MSGAIAVIGATGNIGRGIVQAVIDRGHPVIAVARDAVALEALQLRHDGADLRTLPGSVASDSEGAVLADRLRRLDRPLAGIIASVCGGPMDGRVLDQPAEFLRRKLDDDLLPHLAAARHLLPLLAQAGRGNYVLIGGPGSEYPWAGYGHRSISAAALKMLARVLHDEARAVGVRVQLLSVDVPVCPSGREAASARWPSALAVGQRAAALVEQAAPYSPVVHYEPASGAPFPLGPTSASPMAPCRSLAAVNALLGRLSRTTLNKDLPS